MAYIYVCVYMCIYIYMYIPMPIPIPLPVPLPVPIGLLALNLNTNPESEAQSLTTCQGSHGGEHGDASVLPRLGGSSPTGKNTFFLGLSDCRYHFEVCPRYASGCIRHIGPGFWTIVSACNGVRLWWF